MSSGRPKEELEIKHECHKSYPLQEGEDMSMPVTDSYWCMAEISTILKSNYPSIKKKYSFYKEKKWLYSEVQLSYMK